MAQTQVSGELFLGIDLGTSAVKAIILDDRQRVLGRGSASLAISRPQSLWSEQEPDEWWCAARQAVLQIAPELRRRVRGIGLAGQMHGATVLGANDEVLRPAILWDDGRSHAECEALEKALPASRTITGNRAMPGFTAPKIEWMRKHEPHIFENIRTVLLPKDYLRLRMTGEKASDMSDSAGTLWLDTGARDWSDAMLGATGLSRDQMPRLHEGPDATGLLRQEIAADWGMDRVPVVAGGGDNAAGAIGAGVVADGQAFLSLGTSGVIFVATRDFRPNPSDGVHAFCHCVPDMWHQMAVHLSAASCIDWASRQLGLNGPADVFALAERDGAATGPELFLPYLAGERTPHNDAHVRGAWLCLDHETTPERLCAAVLEGVAFAHADGLAALRAAGTEVESLCVIGGGARSSYWGEILAAVLGAELVYPMGGEMGPALGAARLAAAGKNGTLSPGVFAPPPVQTRIEPDATLAERLAPKLEQFRRAYPAVRTLHERN